MRDVCARLFFDTPLFNQHLLQGIGFPRQFFFGVHQFARASDNPLLQLLIQGLELGMQPGFFNRHPHLMPHRHQQRAFVRGKNAPFLARDMDYSDHPFSGSHRHTQHRLEFFARARGIGIRRVFTQVFDRNQLPGLRRFAAHTLSQGNHRLGRYELIGHLARRPQDELSVFQQAHPARLQIHQFQYAVDGAIQHHVQFERLVDLFADLVERDQMLIF